MATVKTRLAGLVIVALVLTAGCGGGGSDDAPALAGQPAPNVVQPGAPGQPTKRLTPAELAAIPATTHTAEDIRFMQGMIHHHAQALRMTALVRTHTKSRQLALLARRMDISQETEIGLMRKWLLARGEPAPRLHRRHGHAHGVGQGLMPGMLTEKQFKRLAAARGTAFERLFLESMIRHHEGALTMVADLYAADGGGEPELNAFARHVEADQQVEIARMKGDLALLATPSR